MAIYGLVDGVNKEFTQHHGLVDGVNKSFQSIYTLGEGINRTVFGGDVYIYNAGDKMTAITGGWDSGFPVGAYSGFNTGGVLFNTTYVVLDASDYSALAISPTNLINTAPFKQAIINYDVVDKDSSSVEAYFRMGAVPFNYSVSANAVGLDTSTIATGLTATFSLDGYNDSYYFSVVAVCCKIRVNYILLN